MYLCTGCGNLYDTQEEAERCEVSHWKHRKKLETLVYYRDKAKAEHKTVCDYCEHVYYVYGCESNCQYRNICYRNDMFNPKIDES